jgi:hypothetical protein
VAMSRRKPLLVERRFARCREPDEDHAVGHHKMIASRAALQMRDGE